MYRCNKTVSNHGKARSLKNNQRTNGPVNGHLISGPTINTKSSVAKFDIVLKLVKVNSGSSFI